MLTAVKVKKHQLAEGGMKRAGQVWSQAEEQPGSRHAAPPAVAGREGNSGCEAQPECPVFKFVTQKHNILGT